MVSGELKKKYFKASGDHSWDQIGHLWHRGFIKSEKQKEDTEANRHVRDGPIYKQIVSMEILWKY